MWYWLIINMFSFWYLMAMFYVFIIYLFMFINGPVHWLNYHLIGLAFQNLANNLLTLQALKYCCINHGDQRVFQFEIVINVIISSVRFIWIPMWAEAHRVMVSTAAFHARVRGSVPGLGGLKETKNVSSPSTCESQYCGEPPWPRGSVLGLRPPGLEFRILCLEESAISFISPSSA